MNYKKILISISLITFLLFSSCTSSNKDTLKQVEYTVTQGSNYKDAVQAGRIITEFESFSTEAINYHFEIDKYTEEERLDFIDKIEVLRDYLENEAEVSFDKTLSIFVSKDNTLQGIDEKLIISDLSIDSVDFTAAYLQAMFGINSNYGLCYGAACHINKKLYDNTFSSKISIEELRKYYSVNENIILMDLTIPVFKDVYFTKEQNSYAYETAYHFTKDLIERRGLKETINLINNSSKMDISFDIEYANEKNIWLKSIEATQICETPIIPLRYELQIGSEAKIYPYVVNSPSINSYFTIKEGELRREGVIMDYAYIKHYLEMYEQDISALKKYLEPYFDTNKEVIDCYFGEDKKNYFNGSIKYVTPLGAGVHEYVHYLTMFDYRNAAERNKDNDSGWLIEGVAVYCAHYLEDKNVYRMLTECFNKNIIYSVMRLYNKNFIDENEKSNESYIKFFSKIQALNYSRIIDDNKFSIARAYGESNKLDENYKMEGRDLSYAEAGSLVDYLITTYGEDKFFQLYKEYSKLKEIYGKTYEELIGEWKTYLINTYKVEYFTGPEGFKLPFFDDSGAYMDSKSSFVDILGGRTYEYAYCGPDEFEELDLKGKIALIKYDIQNYYKTINYAAEAGALGVIVYCNIPIADSISLEKITVNIPIVSILKGDGIYLKEAKDKRITIDKDFFGIIDNSSTGN